MTDEKWQDLVGRIKDTFSLIDERTEPLMTGPGEQQSVTFASPQGTMKLERIIRPILLDTHAIASKRIGSSATVKKEYSETETSSKVTLSVQRGGEWMPVDLDAALGA